MHPILIDFGRVGGIHLFLPTYGVLFATAVLIAWWWFVRRGRAIGVDDESLFNLTFITLVAGIAGAKLLLIAIDWRFYLAEPAALLRTLRSAGVLAGGVILGAVAFVLYCRRRGLPLWRLGDAIAAPLALAQGIGRLGCFAAGCCWGVDAAPGSPLAVRFTDPVAQAQTGVPLNRDLVAVQPLQMAADIGLAIALTILWRRGGLRAGSIFWIYVIGYALARGILEFWRGDVQRGVWFGGTLSTSQLIGIAAALLALLMLARRGLREPAP